MFSGTCYTKGWKWVFETVPLQRRAIKDIPFNMDAKCIPSGKLKQMSDL